jgi:hypothetical protein
MAAVTDRVDGWRLLHEGADLHEGEHPSGHNEGGSRTNHRRCCPPTHVRQRDILQGHRRLAGSGVSGRAATGCCTQPVSTVVAAGDAPADVESGGGLRSGCL